VNLGLSSLQSLFEGFLDSLEVPDVASGTLKQGNLAGLLVGLGKSLLEATVSVTKLIASPLLRLDALFPDGLATGIVAASGGWGGLEVIILIVGVVVTPARSALVPQGGS
jgi:hypothetical protein